MTKTIISSQPDSLGSYLSKIWQFKTLILTLAKRELQVKYAQTFLGLAWTLLQPLTAIAIYTLFFSGILNFTTTYPYVLFVLSGVMFWGLFNYVFSQGSTSLSSNQELIKKMYFPKIILPFSKVLIGLVEFLVAFIILIVLLIYFQVPFRWTMILSPIAIIPLILCSLGLAMILSTVSLKNRDLFHIVPFLVNFGIWLTPVFYPVSIVPDQFKEFLFINPVAAAIQAFRWCLFGDALNSYVLIGLSLNFLIFIIGFIFFKKAEDKIIDIL